MAGNGTIRQGYTFLTQEVPCVYIIKCIKNGSVYIGQTGSDLTREAHHFTKLRLGQHANWKLQKDYDRFEDEDFYFRRIKNIKDKKFRKWVEADYIIKAKEREFKNPLIERYKIYNIEIPKRNKIGFKFKNETNETDEENTEN